MRNVYDQLGKRLLRALLRQFGRVETQREVLTDVQSIDVTYIPGRAEDAPDDDDGEFEPLDIELTGLLARLAARTALFEPFSKTPGVAAIRGCQRKQLAWAHILADKNPLHDRFVPWLWIVSPGEPRSALRQLGLRPAEAWPDAVLFAPDGYRYAVIVVSALPRNRGTLMLRLLGRRQVLDDAIEDLEALPDDAWEKQIAKPLLMQLQLDVRTIPGDERTPEEEDFLMRTRQTLEEFERETEIRGVLKARREAVLECLEVRNFDVTPEIRERIERCDDPDLLSQWHRHAITAETIQAVFEGER